MESQFPVATREELWRLQEEIKDLFVTQGQHSERIMRLEKRRDEDTRVKNVWGPVSPYPSSFGNSAQQESGFNPAAEAFRNFDADAQSGMITNLSLDHDDERRRGASRANSVRFDESANNHYGSTSRQSVDLLPLRTGSGLGSHPLSERSLSHRSDGKGSMSGISMRANSFGLEQSRLLGSMTSSPKAAGNPPPAFYVLGPVPAIIRCWLTETFSNDSLLYAAVCTGSYASCITTSLIRRYGLDDQTIEENGVRKIKLPIYLTEATIQQSSSRSASPAPQVPTLAAKFVVVDSAVEDRCVQVVIGSDILRAHNADILFSQDKLMIFDEDRNRLAIPLVRPENDATYKGLFTQTSPQGLQGPLPSLTNGTPVAGIIGRPSQDLQAASSLASSSGVTSSSMESDQPKEDQVPTTSEQISIENSAPRPQEDSTYTTEGDRSFTTPTPTSRSNSGVWGNSWRSSSVSQTDPGKTASGYSRAGASRGMKVLRPGKSMASSSRAGSSVGPTGQENNNPNDEGLRSKSGVKMTEPQSQPTKSNPIGQASAFGWLNSGQH
ncbi:hypothetical protein EPUS_05807 [Endocarpon pusillum Z07020]|uniref:Ubiquitin carboxyl-terminal hydrolase 19 n=1 Tax=Endocarpon pusillum (strain Z07020 / HMAS-L-300199) TaxID=1263415 RepID=U1GXK5_ENDPU|nr:uncharacterized protein EPUS_05807 [Endocarpon pusillum Z07020]ERF77238.1 hypothetical protein EPUS_05807 [Endocarpon pusillum Z07020]